MVSPLAERVWWYDLRGVNAYLVEDDGVLTLVDTGTPFDRRALVLGLDELGFRPRAIDRVLLTHYDLDHVGGLGRLQQLDATIYAAQPDAAYLTGDRKPPWRSRKGFSQRLFDLLLSPPADPVEVVEDGDEIGSFTVYHTPGHTPGHVCYVSQALSVAFLGDLVREGDGRLSPSPWILSDDTEQVTASIERLASEDLEFDIAAMGHGVPFENHGAEQLDALAARL